MQIVLLAAGNSSRFYPYINYGHKSFFPIFDKPIIYHTLKSIQATGFKEVIVVVREKKQLEEILKHNTDLDLNITIIEQPEALGMGDALLRAREYLQDSFFVMHAHHVDFADFAEIISREKTEKDQVVLLARKENDIAKFGVLRVDENRVLEIVEKPTNADHVSNLRLIGIYLLSIKFLDSLSSTKLEHYNFETALSEFAQNNLVTYVETQEESVSLKYPWNLFALKNYLFNSQTYSISVNSTVATNVTLEGTVIIEDGAKVMENAVLKGPVYVGANSVVGTNAILREGTVLSANCMVGANMEIRNSIISAGTHFHSGFAGDSLFGQNGRFGAGFNTGNKRLDRQGVDIKLDNKILTTGIHNLGVIVGDNVKVGINVSTMPGTIIGNDSIVGPHTMVRKNVADKTRYYTKFKEIITSITED